MGSFEETLKLHSEEIVDLGRDFKLKLGDNPVMTPDFSPRISYDLLSFKENIEVCFTSESFTKEDFHKYIEKMIEVSKTPIGELMNGLTDLDFKIYPGANKNLREIFFKAIGNKKKHVEQIPSFGRLGLYNSNDGKGKAPRVFFALGHMSTLHILACDPEHKIYDGA